MDVRLPPMGVTPFGGRFLVGVLPRVVSIESRRPTCNATTSGIYSVA
jgi:hypothetical protein